VIEKSKKVIDKMLEMKGWMSVEGSRVLLICTVSHMFANTVLLSIQELWTFAPYFDNSTASTAV